MTSGATQIWGLGTAVPDHRVSQPDSADFLARVLSANDPSDRDRGSVIHRMAERSGIRTRYSVLSDYGSPDPASFSFFPSNWKLDPFPTTATRLELYEAKVVDLAERAATRAIEAAGLDRRQITHLVFTTCTGFFAPGPEQALLSRLGLRRDVKRSLLGFMGCYAGFNALRTADEIVRADPDARVLHVSAELCTLHLQRDSSTATIVSNLLFADGAAAAVYGAGRERSLARVVETASYLTHDTERDMSWRIGDHGFVMKLSPEVPRRLAQSVRPFVEGLLRREGVDAADAGFAVHPGGRRVLEAVGEALAIPDARAKPSFDVLSEFGNMSSATILFVLERALRAFEGPVVALGFGPGLTMEGALLWC
ncbi:MAG: type III polyketide synthase [Myxococcales bacterium]|nr:type III polyketide synthase [Myxococcales bacterium]